MRDEKRSLVARLGGVLVGVAAFVGVNVATGHALLPSIASVSRIDPAFQPSPPEPPKPPYQAVCSACHQAQGQGLPFVFPPLAGSEWMTGDPETPIRIVLLGLGGQIQVNGTSFNLVMPPPPGLDDAKIAEAITYARTSFGNTASAVDAELVKKVRDSLGGRTSPWTAVELTALRTGAQGGGDTANAGAAPAQGAVAAAAAPAKKARAQAGRDAPRRR
ncbi:MAG: cytochrome c [Deltaproteobacteria bacterium]